MNYLLLQLKKTVVLFNITFYKRYDRIRNEISVLISKTKDFFPCETIQRKSAKYFVHLFLYIYALQNLYEFHSNLPHFKCHFGDHPLFALEDQIRWLYSRAHVKGIWLEKKLSCLFVLRLISAALILLCYQRKLMQVSGNVRWHDI
jgi:hypothetical protein